jgi:hypothetical protein
VAAAAVYVAALAVPAFHKVYKKINLGMDI